ncbi:MULTISPECIES: hypothetical protein [Hymenobacter]|uniref:hypothetical protein n=1 Tax=Hymenobacter TaxID=89966 RepID=UPI0012468FDB|nr:MULTISPECIES: hypothetical protein [Hymenobacter]QKG53285.1 hypothetical protein GKZ67_12680 [Hymenobacter sp. BRD67]
MQRFLLLLLLATGLALGPASAQTTPTTGFERTASGTEYQLFRRDAAGHYAPGRWLRPAMRPMPAG